MVKINYTWKNLSSLIFNSTICFGLASLFLGRYGYLRLCGIPISLYVEVLALLAGGGLVLMGFFHLKVYLKESSVLAASSEGLHLKNGTIYKFHEVKEFIPYGLIGFQLKFKDGWFYNPVYIDINEARIVAKLIKEYIELSPEGPKTIDNINLKLKEHHNKSAYAIMLLSLVMIAVPFMPYVTTVNPVPLIFLGLLPLSYGLYKRFRVKPKTFETFHLLKQVEL